MASVREISGMMLIYSVIIALMGCFVLSVDAIRCHQCNSHLDEDCNSLRLAVPRGVRDDQYLGDCEPRNSIEPLFCRKTLTSIHVSGEKRIVRGCGWNMQGIHGKNDSCLASENEGFFEQSCVCFTDGCNSAPRTGRIDVSVALGAGLLLLMAAAARRG